MNEQQEPVLHALTFEPRVARPGETVRLCFRTPNLGAAASPPAHVRFTLPAELEGQDELVQPVDPVPPGEDVVAILRARVVGPLDDATELTACASLELEKRTLATNPCILLVRSSPILDGQASGVSVLAHDEQTVRVHAVISNEGDGPACDLHLVVPPPLGCVRTEGEGPATLTLPRLDAGERVELAFEARIVAPVRSIAADDAFVRCGGREPVPLPARERVEAQPSLAPPAASIALVGRRAEITIAVRNDGWADACGAILRIALPAPLRPLEGSIVVDGVAAIRRARGEAFAWFARDATTTTIALARIRARASVEVSFAAAIPAGFSGAPLRLQLDRHDVTVPLDVVPVRALRLAVVDAPRTVEPGASLTLIAEIANAGDVAEQIVLSASGAALFSAGDPVSRTLAPGTVAQVPLALQIVSDARDDARLAVAVAASDANGERVLTEVELIVRDRASLVLLEPPLPVEGGVAYMLRNAGTTTAREVSAEIGGTMYVLGAIAAGASVSAIARESEARAGGIVRVGGREVLALPALEGANPDVRIGLEASAEVVAGAPFVVCARIVVREPADRIAIRVLPVDGAAYIPGSTVLDGVGLLDRLGSSPLAGAGLVLRGVPGATESILAWSMLADATRGDGELMISATGVAESQEICAEPVVVAVRARDAFAARPSGLGYHVEACALPPVPQEPHIGVPPIPEPALVFDPSPAFEPLTAPSREDAFFFSLTPEERRLDEIARVLRDAESGSLAAHLLALRAFFPQDESSGDLLVRGALHEAGNALRDVFDRLFVKLRIPGFEVAAFDLEDAPLRRALITLFERIAVATPGDEPYGTIVARVERARVGAILANLREGGYGAPETLRGLVALLPTAYEDEPLLTAALQRYAGALDAALARCEGLPRDAYDAVLTAQRQDDLDDARSILLAALRARERFAGAA